MADFIYDDGTGDQNLHSAEEFTKWVCGPAADPDHVCSNDELGDFLGRYRKAAYRQGFEVKPDAEETKQAREWYASVAGTPIDKITNPRARETAERRVAEHAQQLADSAYDGAYRTISATLTAASDKHNREWGAYDNQQHAAEYQKALAELEAENVQLSAWDALKQKIGAISDPERRAAWMERYPALWE